MIDVLEAAEKLKARGESAPRLAADPVNLPMIRHWTEALGYATDPSVPPAAMIQVWTMYGLRGERPDDDPLGVMTRVLDDAGYTSVVATNCEQTYHRGLRVGERVSVTSRLEEVTGPKRTALGEGWFVTTHSTWRVGEEPVAEMRFRILKFRPAPRPAGSGEVLRPPVSRDTAYFWEGMVAGELRIQRCDGCGLLRHPPGPMCPRCGKTSMGYAVAAGHGEVFSFVVQHHPPTPGRQPPYVVALVELAEGVRILAELVGIDPAEVHIGMPVRIGFQRIDDDLTLPIWRPRDTALTAGDEAPGSSDGEVLPELAIEATPTFVVSTALATRDFQDVHHDRDAAVVRGSKDIFLNILTTTGLVERYVTERVGHDAAIREIALRLAAPCYAGDTLVLRGRLVDRRDDVDVVEVVGRVSLGDHVTATVKVAR